MEFRFNVNEVFKSPIVEVGHTLIPSDFKGDRRLLWDALSKVADVINAMGTASAAAQSLTRPITSAERLRNSEQQKVYLLVDKDANDGRGAVTGMLKTGTKGLYVFDRDGQHYHVQAAPCILDFYVHESKQRSGFGKKLFEHMLQRENVQPGKLAIDRPSEKFLGFLNKHYNLNNPIRQMNNYVVYDGFFPQGGDAGDKSPVNNNGDTMTKRGSNGLQAQTVISPYGRYGAPRPPCSMGQIIHNQSATMPVQEPPGIEESAQNEYQPPCIAPLEEYPTEIPNSQSQPPNNTQESFQPESLKSAIHPSANIPTNEQEQARNFNQHQHVVHRQVTKTPSIKQIVKAQRFNKFIDQDIKRDDHFNHFAQPGAHGFTNATVAFPENGKFQNVLPNNTQPVSENVQNYNSHNYYNQNLKNQYNLQNFNNQQHLVNPPNVHYQHLSNSVNANNQQAGFNYPLYNDQQFPHQYQIPDAPPQYLSQPQINIQPQVSAPKMQEHNQEISQEIPYISHSPQRLINVDHSPQQLGNVDNQQQKLNQEELQAMQLNKVTPVIVKQSNNVDPEQVGLPENISGNIKSNAPQNNRHTNNQNWNNVPQDFNQEAFYKQNPTQQNHVRFQQEGTDEGMGKQDGLGMNQPKTDQSISGVNQQNRGANFEVNADPNQTKMEMNVTKGNGELLHISDQSQGINNQDVGGDQQCLESNHGNVGEKQLKIAENVNETQINNQFMKQHQNYGQHLDGNYQHGNKSNIPQEINSNQKQDYNTENSSYVNPQQLQHNVSNIQAAVPNFNQNHLRNINYQQNNISEMQHYGPNFNPQQRHQDMHQQINQQLQIQQQSMHPREYEDRKCGIINQPLNGINSPDYYQNINLNNRRYSERGVNEIPVQPQNHANLQSNVNAYNSGQNNELIRNNVVFGNSVIQGQNNFIPDNTQSFVQGAEQQRQFQSHQNSQYQSKMNSENYQAMQNQWIQNGNYAYDQNNQGNFLRQKERVSDWNIQGLRRETRQPIASRVMSPKLVGNKISMPERSSEERYVNNNYGGYNNDKNYPVSSNITANKDFSKVVADNKVIPNNNNVVVTNKEITNVSQENKMEQQGDIKNTQQTTIGIDQSKAQKPHMHSYGDFSRDDNKLLSEKTSSNGLQVESLSQNETFIKLPLHEEPLLPVDPLQRHSACYKPRLSNGSDFMYQHERRRPSSVSPLQRNMARARAPNGNVHQNRNLERISHIYCGHPTRSVADSISNMQTGSKLFAFGGPQTPVRALEESTPQPKLDRPQTLSLHTSIDQNNPPPQIIDDDEEEEIDNNLDNIENDFMKVEVSPSNRPPPPRADQPEEEPPARKTPSHLTEQGYFDLKFYHNKLW